MKTKKNTKSIYTSTKKDLKTIDSINSARQNRNYEATEYQDKFIYNAF